MGDTSWLVLARAHGIPLAAAARQASFLKPRAVALGAPLPSFVEPSRLRPARMKGVSGEVVRW